MSSEEYPHELDPMQIALREAMSRMINVAPEDEFALAWEASLGDADDVSRFITENESNITPETLFFLRTSEAIKRASGR